MSRFEIADVRVVFYIFGRKKRYALFAFAGCSPKFKVNVESPLMQFGDIRLRSYEDHGAFGLEQAS